MVRVFLQKYDSDSMPLARPRVSFGARGRVDTLYYDATHYDGDSGAYRGKHLPCGHALRRCVPRAAGTTIASTRQEVRLRRVRYHNTTPFDKIAVIAEQSHDNRNGRFDRDAFKRKYIYSAMSFAAIRVDGDPLAVFLTEASAERRLTPGPCLVDTTIVGVQQLASVVGRNGFEYLAQRMGLSVTRAELKRKDFWHGRRCSEPVPESPRLYAEA
ncbi:hypothetical protein MMC22_005680 [Lobaria immixta]|nr:hypothetical protein [Lobaria immixta]